MFFCQDFFFGLFLFFYFVVVLGVFCERNVFFFDGGYGGGDVEVFEVVVGVEGGEGGEFGEGYGWVEGFVVEEEFEEGFVIGFGREVYEEFVGQMMEDGIVQVEGVVCSDYDEGVCFVDVVLLVEELVDQFVMDGVVQVYVLVSEECVSFIDEDDVRRQLFCKGEDCVDKFFVFVDIFVVDGCVVKFKYIGFVVFCDSFCEYGFVGIGRFVQKIVIDFVVFENVVREGIRVLEGE